MKEVIYLVLLGLICYSAVLADGTDNGTLAESVAPTGRIINGIALYSPKYKYMLSIRYNGKHGCGAVVITSSHAVTSGTCVEFVKDLSKISLYGNSHVTVGSGVTFRVIRIVLHPQFVRDKWPFGAEYNIAVLRVPTSAFSGYANISPIFIERNPIPDNTRCFILGFGTKNYPGLGDSNDVLQQLYVNIVPEKTCAALWARFPAQKITAQTICAIGTNAAACNGDLGGPLVCGDKLAGILSFFESNCGFRLPTGFTKISAPYVRGFLIREVKN